MISVEGNVLAGTISQAFEKYRRNHIYKDYGIRLLLRAINHELKVMCETQRAPYNETFISSIRKTEKPDDRDQVLIISVAEL